MKLAMMIGAVSILLSATTASAAPKWQYATLMNGQGFAGFESTAKQYPEAGNDAVGKLYHDLGGSASVNDKEVDTAQLLDQIGAMGWELVSYTGDVAGNGYYVFKRPAE